MSDTQNLFQNACMAYKHAYLQSTYITVAAFHIYAQHSEDVAKRGGWRPCIK